MSRSSSLLQVAFALRSTPSDPRRHSTCQQYDCKGEATAAATVARRASCVRREGGRQSAASAPVFA
eukprot:scaffold305_cov247-Pinguiococcus_pyrenoidosus.AAC.12